MIIESIAVTLLVAALGIIFNIIIKIENELMRRKIRKMLIDYSKTKDSNKLKQLYEYVK